jgi:hypothetical protein
MATARASRFSVRLIALTLISCLISLAQSTPPVVGKLVGVWIENEAKLKIGGSFASLRFRQTSDAGMEELRGPELKPLVQPVKFGEKAYGIDGSKNTIEWKQIDASHFERKIFNEGKLQNIRRIQISSDGKTLTQVTESTLPSGKKEFAKVIYQRTSGGPQGLVGVWKPQSVKTSPPAEMRFEAAGTSGLKVTFETGVNYTFNLDNTPVVVNGTTVIAGTMIAVRSVDDHTLESTSTREGTVTGKTTLSISSDGKTLTTTSTAIGPDGNREPNVSVYEKK